MAYREVAMWEILQVLRRLDRRENKSAIAREMGHSRSTVRRYEALAKSLGWTPGSTTEPTEELAAGIARRINPATDRVVGDPLARPNDDLATVDVDVFHPDGKAF